MILKNCYHYVLWFNNNYYNNIIKINSEENIINDIVKLKFKNDDYIYFEN